jgi:uncharacterized protein with von Willebrand factor type A (vWA) domain
MSDDAIVHLARFAAALRSRGVSIGVGDEVDAIRALTLVDVADSNEVRRALLVALKIRARDRAIFADVFDRSWSAADATNRRRAEPTASAPAGPALGAIRRADSAVGFAEDEAAATANEAAAYSADVALRRKPFEECSAGDLAEMERLLDRWMPRWAARPSRRLTPARSGGIPDLRRSFRRTVVTDGEMLPLARRKRAIDEPRLVVLCDTSGSMDAHVRFVLAFILALKRVSRRTEVFAFNTSLTRLTPWLSPGRVLSTLERLATGVSDWSGGTRIGESLAEFVAKYLSELVDRKTVIVIVSDGLDRGDTTLVAAAMRALSAKARRIVWLNPLSGDPRYEPTARAMQAALPFIDRFGPAHNLESLERILPELAA